MFSVGDKVIVRSFDSIPKARIKDVAGDDPMLWSRRKAVVCGKTATVSDAYNSEKYGTRVYRLRIEGSKTDSTSLFLGEDLTPYSEEARWKIKFGTLQGIVTARLFIDGEEVCEGYGRVYSDDAVGYVQAASWAMKKLWLKYTGNERED